MGGSSEHRSPITLSDAGRSASEDGTSAVIDNTGGYGDAVTPGGGLQPAGP